ncbi:hypothetical protein LOTGIDRAFT_218629 [Lottia gigantea]|uniref:Uncharacterized protein n=1 Tax=Lottia gigantea TaxID=225164 RepID=V4BLV1_LOTGI|nr:hypothetical protein LOTGIDRAFT_218629 [Lottia gigantea]ESO89799.1 hypothetical protein LOTGIDRAFT_218629 [Lottia gigantea]
MLEYFICFFAFIAALAAAFYMYITWHHGLFKKFGIPGPEPTFMGQLTKYGGVAVGEMDRELMKKYGKVVGYYHGRTPVLNVGDPDLVKEICIKHFNNFSSRPFNVPKDLYEEAFLTVVNGERWRNSRSVLSPSFTSGKMRAMVPLMKNCVENFLKHLEKHAESGKAVDVKTMFSGFTLDVICTTAFGIDIDSQGNPDNPLILAAKDASQFNLRNPFNLICILLPFTIPIMDFFGVGFMKREPKKFMIDTIEKVIAERQNNPSDRADFVSLAMKAKEDSEKRQEGRVFNQHDLIGNLLVFMLAAYDTTSTTLSFVSYCLATHPDIQDKVLHEINQKLGKDEEPDHENITKLKYLQQVIDETLRLFPALIRTVRYCAEDIDINGTFIAKGTEISFPVFAIQRDPDFWENPDVFDPERFSPENKESINPYSHMPFGMGPRNCIGQRLALLELKLVLVCILRSYKICCTPETETPNVKMAKGELFLRTEKPIHVRFEKR